ncbi:MAG: glycine zipper 2TM domain-containing protein [Proteobacteria bacterium]|nr:glycine zipper 2TM domain-containing protein [Pseudomonadota bacterium]
MTKVSTYAKGALAATAGLIALAAAASASAQPYSDYNACDRQAGNRGIAGALVGGALGAVVGSQAAANHHRTDGSLLGGALGALAGGVIGNKTASCNTAPPPPPAPIAEAPPPPPPPPSATYYEGAPPPPPPPVYAEGYGPPPPPPPPVVYERPATWVYGRHGVRYRVVMDRAGPDGCTMAEGPPVYDGYGRMAPSWVRVCPDYRGRYRIVY